MAWWTDGALERVPDWKLDRLAIRLALFGRERLGLEPGERVAVMGRLGWLWPALDFAAMGFGVVPVGLEHDLSDDAVALACAEAAPRAVFATDARERCAARGGCDGRAASAARPSSARGWPRRRVSCPSRRLMDLAAVLDTAERAQAFRARTRARSPPRARPCGTPGREASSA